MGGIILERGESVAESAAAAVRYLAEHGFESTTVGDLADAIGMSRSTFFRRFRSKEDVVFADHDLALARLEELLSDTELTPSEALSRSTVEVLHTLVRDTHAARLRWELLRQNPSLRERDLVITHRYERVFVEYLERIAPPGAPQWAPVALAASLVAVHNAALRRWLRDSDPRALGALDRELRELTAQFAPWFAESGGSRRVVVAVFDPGASSDEIAGAIEAQLGR